MDTENASSFTNSVLLTSLLSGSFIGLMSFPVVSESAQEALSNDYSIETTTREENVSTDENLAIEFDQFVSEYCEADQIPGASVALVYEGKVILLKGYGYRDIESQLPATPDTLFHIASTQKSMTAMLIATLVDDEIVNWDTPLVEISPEFKFGNSGGLITLRHLLSMTSGIPNTAEDDFYAQSHEENAFSMWPLLATIEPLGEPGAVFSYSNISSSMAGYAAVLLVKPDAADLDTAYGELLFERVIQPIGMSAAEFSVEDARKNPNYGKSYVLDAGQPVAAAPQDFATDTMTPAGVVKASATDMALYIQTQLAHGVAPNGKRIVSKANMEEMWKPQTTDDNGDWYALGWSGAEYRNTTVIYHEGSFDHYESVIGFIPQLKLGFVVLTNSSDMAADLVGDTPWQLIDIALELQ